MWGYFIGIAAGREGLHSFAAVCLGSKGGGRGRVCCGSDCGSTWDVIKLLFTFSLADLI